ncbi:uncharacterized protein PGTG_19589 [Puccinia graminis f. sp. tritici CRL 75-36-700-3]|uniref:Uncharacterized protein n=1 Tax=Puccinia graminis f. sp. tritici (strain CRL 75-36-700-3 / race SCCL) TaxID=418459 RepID=E3LAR5_PUCGT|nr:uncharacterized protein PGTG_19589 [Puccinia graminis f. sp. tritici CRL 75-36-700-3]EFP93640.1 hypothetical protein PGTG_19589 [Puccinia graminis f. sp. tritici CRL 75-36-700-3]
MSASQVDPILMNFTPSGHSLNVSDLNLGTEIPHQSVDQTDSPNDTTSGPRKKGPHPRRTKDEMILFRAEQDRLKKAKSQAKAKGKRGRTSQPRGRLSRGVQNVTDGDVPLTRPASAPPASQPPLSDFNPPFITEDYENVCGYLEEEANYTQLYGDGSKTTVGTTKVTKAAAYDIFAIYINDNSNRRLHLTGSQLRQRIDGYKKRFMKAKDWAENTGAGIEEGDNLPTVADLLEKKCPCYERMYGIFGGKANVSPLAQHDSGAGAGLYGDAEGHPQGESQEVFLSGWEDTQDELPLDPLDTPGLHLNDDELPPPLNLSGTAMDASPSLMTLRSLAQNGTPVAPFSTPDIGAGTPGENRSGTRRAFANQPSADASPAGPHRELNPARHKPSLASAFESSNADKFAYLKEHMAWEKQKEDKRLEWEKERFNKEIDQAKIGAQAHVQLAQTKLAAAQDLLKTGTSASEVDALLKTIYG